MAVVDPRRVRAFARANGQLAKTDRLDAQTIAHFAQVVQPHARPRPCPARTYLAGLVARRRQLLGTLRRKEIAAAMSTPSSRRAWKPTLPG